MTAGNVYCLVNLIALQLAILEKEVVVYLLALCRLGLGGPVFAEAKQPPAYRLAVLPARDSVTWRFTVQITSFGRACVQAFVSLPVQVPLEPGKALHYHESLATSTGNCSESLDFCVAWSQ